MDSAVVYKIAKWEEVFEKSDHRKCRSMHWVSLPVSFTSTGYVDLLDHFEGDAAQMYGCWCALLLLASQCPVRGVLCDTKGRPRTLNWLQRTSGFPAELFDRLLKWAASPSVKWLVTVPAEELTVMLSRASTETPFERSGQHPEGVGMASRVLSGTNPEETAILPDESTIPPDKSPCLPEGFRTTRQDITEQDKTKHNINTTSIRGSKEDAMEEILKSQFDRGRCDELFCDQVKHLANKLVSMRMKARIRKEDLPHELIWQVAWVCQALDLSVAHGCIERIRTNQVQKPVNYLLGAVRKLCQNHASLDWERVKKLVPSAPPPKVEEPMAAGATA